MNVIQDFKELTSLTSIYIYLEFICLNKDVVLIIAV